MAALAPSPTSAAVDAAAPADGVTAETPSQRGMRWAWLLGAAGISLVFTVQQLRDPDVWWHLAAGNLIRAHGIPAQEPFSFLGAPNPWIGQQWGYEVALSWMYAAGAFLPMVVMGLVATLALVVAVRSIPRAVRVPGPFLAAALLLSGLVAATVLGVRGQVVTVLGTAVVLWILARWRDGSRGAVWLLPPLLLVWANLHAGFVNGLALCVVVALSVAVWRSVRPGAVAQARLRLLLLATAVAGLATLVNPAGVHLYPYIASTFTNPTLTSGITEWMSPNFHDTWLRLFELEAVLLVALWTVSRRPDPVDVVLGIGAVAMTLQAQRNVALFAVIAAPQVARYGWTAWSGWAGRPRPPMLSRPRPALPALLMAALLTVVVGVAQIAPMGRAAAVAEDQARRFPVAAATYVAAHLPGQQLYSTYEWGGYLAYRFPSPRMVYIYGESAVFGSDRLQRYLDIHLVRSNWRDVLREDGMSSAILPADAQEVTAFLETGWATLCHDTASDAVVMHAIGADPSKATPPDPRSAPAC
jgi:hypothetical protein